MIDESIACSQGLVPLTPRVDIHHQKKTNKKALHSQKIDSFHRESAFSFFKQQNFNMLYVVFQLSKNFRAYLANGL